MPGTLVHCRQLGCSVAGFSGRLPHVPAASLRRTQPTVFRGSMLRAAPDVQEPGSAPRGAPSLVEVNAVELTPSSTEATAAADGSTTVYTLMTALAGAGAVETAYLTYVKLFDAPVACPTSGCESVLTSEFSTLFGLPLSLFGLGAYAAVAALSALSRQQQVQGASAQQREPVALALTGGVAALATTSAFLVYILQTKFAGSPCAWCYLSASLSAGLALSLAAALGKRQLQDAAGPSLGMVAATVAILYFGVPGAATQVQAYGDDFQLEYRLPPVVTTSSDRAVDLARRLKAVGARMYGAFWCSHCLEQKEAFGAQAMADFPYVECYPTGWRKGVELAPACSAAGVKAFPTWYFGSETVEGALTLDEVEAELQKAEAAALAAQQEAQATA